MTKVLLATIIAAFVGSAPFSTANAGGSGYKTYRDRLGWGNPNGTKLTGAMLGSASTGTIISVILPSGEILELRQSDNRAQRRRQ
jgi:hypothetical protein